MKWVFRDLYVEMEEQQMRFEELKQYYEDNGWNVRIYDTVPIRIPKASRRFIEVEYFEKIESTH